MSDRPASLAADSEAVVDDTFAPSGPPAEGVSQDAGREPGLWQRRIVAPMRALLTRGLSPDRIAATVATGAVCSLCPIFGTTTMLNIAAGAWLRMNHPILQALNQLFGPLQLVMMVAYVRFGGWMFGHEGDPFTLDALKRTFQDASWTELLETFGRAGLHGFAAWIMTAPLLFGVVYLPARAIAHRFKRRQPAHECGV